MSVSGARLRIAIVIVIVTAIGVAVYFLLSQEDPEGPVAIMRSGDAKVLAGGAALYKQHCAACHGANLEGQRDWRKKNNDGTLPAPPHDESGHTWHHPDQVLFQYTKFGGSRFSRGAFRSAMPGFAGQMSDDEIAQIIAYIKSRWPERIRERQAAMNDANAKRR